MNTRIRRTLWIVTLLAVASSCRGKPRQSETLPTPMSLGTPGAGAAATTAAQPTRAATDAASNRPPEVQSVQIEIPGAVGEGHPNVRDTLKAIVKTADADGDLITLKLRWSLNGKELATGDTLPPGGFKKKDVVMVEATATDGRGAESTVSRANVIIRNSPPEITSAPGSLNGYHPSAVDPDGDPVTVEMTTPLAGFTFAGGTLSFDPATGKDSKGKMLTFVAKDNDGATAQQSITINF